METEKKYMLFMCDRYYPYGGLDDLKGMYDSVEKAKFAALNEHKISCGAHGHIVDAETLDVVVRYDRDIDKDLRDYVDVWSDEDSEE